MQGVLATSRTSCHVCSHQPRAKLPSIAVHNCTGRRPSYVRGVLAMKVQQQQQQQQQGPVVRRGDRLQMQAGPVDAAPTWTLDQIAGLAFGALMVVFYFSANAVDIWVAKQQRRELGLCEECGGVYDATTCDKQNCPLKAQQR